MKRIFKRLLTFVCVLTLFSSLTTTFAATKFTDVPTSYWAYNEINFIVDKGLFNGTTATTFSPEAQMKRGQLAAVLYRYAGEPKVTGTSGYSDVSSSMYYADACTWAKKNNIFMADKLNATNLNPDEGITRSEFAVMLYNFAKLNGVAEVDKNAKNPFTDMKDVSDELKTALVNWAVPAGVLNGTSSTTMSPFAAIKRSHVAAMLYRYETEVANPDSSTGTGTNTGTNNGNNTSTGTQTGTYTAGDTLTLKKGATYTVNIGVGEKVYINYGELDGSNNTDWIEYDQNQYDAGGRQISKISWDSSKKCAAIEGFVTGSMTIQCLATSDYKTVLATINVTVGSTSTGNSGSGNSGSTSSTSGDYMDIREEIVRLTNEVRKENGVAALLTDDALMEAAQMAAEEYATRISSLTDHDMKMEAEMRRAAGIAYGGGSNLTWGTLGGVESGVAAKAVSNWENSPGHFRTMVDSGLDNIGVGVAKNGSTWVCIQFFGDKDSALGTYS